MAKKGISDDCPYGKKDFYGNDLQQKIALEVTAYCKGRSSVVTACSNEWLQWELWKKCFNGKWLLNRMAIVATGYDKGRL